jgi:hypothetical protein
MVKRFRRKLYLINELAIPTVNSKIKTINRLVIAGRVPNPDQSSGALDNGKL